SAAAGPVGRHASAGTDWKLNSELLTYSRSKGVFAGVTLEGAVIEQDNDSTEAIYGRQAKYRSILTGKVPAPADTRAFLATVAEVARAAHKQEAKENSPTK